MIVKVEELLNSPIEEVWAAITNPQEMRQWYFDTISDFKPEVGFSTRLTMDSGERKFNATWVVKRVVPGREIQYNWSYDEYEGEGPVTFSLLPKGDKTLITVINEGLETFPSEIPEFTKESCKGGWEYFIQQRLPEYLESKGGNN